MERLLVFHSKIELYDTNLLQFSLFIQSQANYQLYLLLNLCQIPFPGSVLDICKGKKSACYSLLNEISLSACNLRNILI